MSAHTRERQAAWPRLLIEGGLNLPQTFSALDRDNLKRSLRTWFLSDPSDTVVVLTDADLEQIVPGEFVLRFSTKNAIPEQQIRDAVRHLILRTYNLVSENGELPSSNEVSAIERLIRDERLPGVFPVSEELGKLQPP